MIAILDGPRVWEIKLIDKKLDIVLVDSENKNSSSGTQKITEEELKSTRRLRHPLPEEDIRKAFALFCKEAEILDRNLEKTGRIILREVTL